MENTAVSDNSSANGAGNAWTHFWFTPISAMGLRMLRVLAGLLFCAWVLSFFGHQAEFFSLGGWLDEQAYQDVQRQPGGAMAPIGWSIFYWAGASAPAFQTLYWVSVAILVLFTLGIATRITGVLTWVVVVSFLANPVTSFEGDYLVAILAFYLALGHLLAGQWNGDLTPAERILGSRRDFLLADWLFAKKEDARLSVAANFTLRLLQIHFVIILLTSALHRLQMAEWWSGVAFWFPLHPPFVTSADSLKDEIARPTYTLFYLSLAQYAALAWQLALPAFAWRPGRGWRVLLLGGALLYWLGVFFVYRLPLFGPFVFLCCMSFVRPDEWAAIFARVSSAMGGAAPEEKKALALAGKDIVKK